MKIYNVKKTVSTEKITEHYDSVAFENLKDAELFYQKKNYENINLHL